MTEKRELTDVSERAHEPSVVVECVGGLALAVVGYVALVAFLVIAGEGKGLW